jgi:DNA-binding transcriptional LysR family regulator
LIQLADSEFLIADHAGGNMELYQLRSFVAVAEEGHVTRAAQRLYTSQPSVSAHIKALEDEFGVPLFVRTPKGMILTKRGELLKAQAEKCLAEVKELWRQAQHFQENLAGVVRIGVNTYPETLKISALLSLLASAYPLVECHFYQSNSQKIPEQLKAGTLDVGFMYGKSVFAEIAAVPLQTSQLFITGPVAWQDRLEQADWPALAQLPWIGTFEWCAFHAIRQALFQQHRLQPNIVTIADGEATLKNLALGGVGVTLLTAADALAAERKGQAALWKQETFPLKLAFVYWQERGADPLIQAVASAIELIGNPLK